jgi:hypothetical protein
MLVRRSVGRLHKKGTRADDGPEHVDFNPTYKSVAVEYCLEHPWEGQGSRQTDDDFE